VFRLDAVALEGQSGAVGDDEAFGQMRKVGRQIVG
jgi:hypothetical protein